ncbi:restriction endonuclease subunit S [Clostridium botulinum]|uniref:restriction endonuclease subunit S n=1 Tax=Clostridium botulinum TaxID=1491 RepID=UPI001968728E|nr:restriction endonuclease subunit S [Clostridium botulinum]
MNKNKVNVPKIRFPRFTNPWEQRKVSEICSISTGKSNTQDKIDDGVYPFYVRSATIERSNKYLYDEEAVLTVGDGVGTGKVYHYVTGKYDLHQRVYRMFDFTKGVVGKFFYLQFSKNFIKRVNAMTAKTSVDSVRLEMISEMKITTPSIKEQNQISEFFFNLDNLITLHQRKLNHLKDKKKGLLQKMFPKNGEKFPELRFPGFTDPWEQRKLKDVAYYIRGSFPQPYTNSDFYDEENGKPFVQVADIGFDLRLNPDTKAHISKIAEPKSRFVEAGKVVVALQGSIEKSIGRTAITQYDAYFDRTILIFQEYKLPIDKQYFAQVIKKLFEIEKERAWGATISTITKEHLNDFIIGVPKIEEQHKIGEYFTMLDNLITLHQRKLNHLQQQKKGLLQQMFI